MSRTLDEVLLEPVRLQLLELSRLAAPEEACGLLEWDGERMRVHVLLNVAEDPQTSFLCDPYEQMTCIRAIFDRDTELWALWHSHPTQAAEPSETDRAFAAELGDLRWVIVGLEPQSIWVGHP